VNRYDILANENMKIYNLKANGAKSIDQKGDLYKRTSSRVLSYYVVDNEQLNLEFCIPKNSVFDMSLLESSFDLLNNPAFKIQARENWMMPMPFVLNDAVVIQQKIRQSAAITSIPVAVAATAKIAKDSTAQLVDTLKTK